MRNGDVCAFVARETAESLLMLALVLVLVSASEESFSPGAAFKLLTLLLYAELEPDGGTIGT